MTYLVNVRTMDADLKRDVIVHVVAPDWPSAANFVDDALKTIAEPSDVAIAVVSEDWCCDSHSDDLRCGMPLLN